VLDPAGLPARTLTDRSLFQVEGFTDSGDPVAVLTRVDRQAQGLRAARFIRRWTRDGLHVSDFGPGEAIDGATVTNEATGTQIVMVGDDSAIVAHGWDVSWLERWGGESAAVLLPTDSVWSALGFAEGPESYLDGHPIAVSPANGGNYWVIGAVRRLTPDAESRLVEAAPPVRGETESSYRRDSPSVRDAVYDAAILLVDGEGRVLGATTTESYLWGFSSPGEVYSYAEDAETGLVTITVWALSSRCPA